MIQTNEHDKHLKLVGVDGDADSLGPGVFRVGLGAVTETETKMVLTRTRTIKQKKKAVLVSVWLKESYYKKYDIN